MAKLSEYSKGTQSRLIWTVDELWQHGYDPTFIADWLNVPVGVVLECHELAEEDNDIFGDDDE